MRIAVDIDDTLNIVDRVGRTTAYVQRKGLPFKVINERSNWFLHVLDWGEEDVAAFMRDGGLSAFTEAEARIIDEMKPYISGEYSISSEKKTKISEIFFNDGGDRYYLVKVNFITIDENKGVEKKTVSQILVQASDFEDAVDKFKEGMKGTMADYEIASITETFIMDVFGADPNPGE